MKNITKYTLALLLVLCSLLIEVNAQVAINENNSEPDASAMLDVSSTDKGLLIPRMTTKDRDAIENPSEGLMIFNTEDDCFNYYTGMEWYKDCGRDLETDNVIYDPIITTSESGNNAEEVVFDDNGNAYITGEFSDDFQIGDTTLTSNGNSDIYLAKFDRDNNLIWVVQVGSDAVDDDPSIAIDHQGNIILTAEFFSTLTIGTSSLSPAGGRDILVAKYNNDGVSQWAQQLGFSDVGLEPSVAVDANDNIYLSGYFEGTTTIASTTLSNPSAGDYASYIIKMDTNGTAQWAQQLDVVDDDLQIYDIAVQGSSVYVAGAMEGTLATIGTDTYTIQGGLDGFFAQYDLDGNYVASSHLISSYYVECYTIAVDQNGNIFVGGYAFENMDFDGTTFQILDGECLFIAKYDASQDLEWVRYQDQNDDSEINALCIDDENNVIGIGRFEGKMDFDTITVTTAKNFDEVFVLKYDTDGNFEWVEKGTSNDSSRDFAYGIGISPQSVIYALGKFSGTVGFSDVSMTSSGDSDALILRLNNEDGSQSFFDNSLAGSQDGDTDPSNELQDISLNGNSLSISKGSEVNLATLQDNLGDHTATQNIQLNDNWLSNDGGDEGIQVNDNGGVSTSNSLSVGGNITGVSNIYLDQGTQRLTIRADQSAGRIHFDVGGTNASNDAFVFGDLSNGKNALLTLGNMGVGTFSAPQKLTVGASGDGTKGIANDWDTWSDKRLKRDFQEITNPLQKLNAINGYYYYWRADKPDQSKQIGVIAQEIETILPEIVSTNPDGYKSVDYSKLTAFLIEVNQAQQQEIDDLKIQVAKISQLEAMLESLQAQVSNSINTNTTTED